MTAALRVEGATVRFAQSLALDRVDLDVAAGQVTAVLGPSGSGKSTLLRVVVGLQPLDHGRVFVGGSDLAGVAPHRRGVGMMFQEHALFPHRDVARNIGFGLRMQRRSPREVTTRVNELLELVDLVGFGDRRIQTLSGGEQQRVALARALAPRPDVLLLDEPLGALDRTLRESLTIELRALFTRLGLTVVAVTHDQEEAFSLADRVLLLDAGTVLQTGVPAQVWERPVSRRAAQLLGFANIVDAQVVSGHVKTPWGDVVLAVADGPATILIRPAGVHLSRPAGGLVGIVQGSRFMGDRTCLRIAVDGAPILDALVATAAAPRVGEQVNVQIGPGATVVIGP